MRKKHASIKNIVLCVKQKSVRMRQVNLNISFWSTPLQLGIARGLAYSRFNTICCAKKILSALQSTGGEFSPRRKKKGHFNYNTAFNETSAPLPLAMYRGTANYRNARNRQKESDQLTR